MWLSQKRACRECSAKPPGREQRILTTGADRTEKRMAPERSRPMGRFTYLAEAVSRFQEARAKSMDFVSANTRDLRALEVDHPAFGCISALECLHS
jgi:hypothetical protein